MIHGREFVLPYLVAPGLINLKGLDVLVPEKITDDDIFDAVCSHFNIEKKRILSRSSVGEVVYTRHCCMYLFCVLAQRSLKNTAALFLGKTRGVKHHSTVIHARENIKELMFGNQYIPYTNTHAKDDIDEIIEIIKHKKIGITLKEINQLNKKVIQ